MECINCKYEGKPEFGEFKPEETWRLTIHIRCPKCKNYNNILRDDIDTVESELRYPSMCYGSVDSGKHKETEKEIKFLIGKHGIGSYSIYCPKCNWGSCCGIDNKKVEQMIKLRDEYQNKKIKDVEFY